MATAEQIKALVKSHADGDDARFYSVAMQVAAAEAKQGHTDFATKLRLLMRVWPQTYRRGRPRLSAA